MTGAAAFLDMPSIGSMFADVRHLGSKHVLAHNLTP